MNITVSSFPQTDLPSSTKWIGDLTIHLLVYLSTLTMNLV